jgi:hypothetical membrane protein
VLTDATMPRRRLAAAAMAGVVAYVVVDVILQSLPPHYSAIREAESNLAVGPYGWIMNLNFLGRAATTVCAVLAIRRVGRASRLRRTGLALLAVGGIASAILAFFPTDIRTAEPGSQGTDYTSAGTVHLVVATVGFVAALAGVIVLTAWVVRSPQLTRIRSVAIGCAGLAAVGLLVLGLSVTVTPGILGLAERICLAGILGWTFVACAGIRRLPEMSRLQP